MEIETAHHDGLDETIEDADVIVVPGPSDVQSSEASIDAVDRLLDEVELALARLEDGTYGACESCGALIDDDRLAESPTVRFCSTCPESGDGPVPGGADPAA
jgi:RNA polymerase-binding transcription factor DksA